MYELLSPMPEEEPIAVWRYGAKVGWSWTRGKVLLLRDGTHWRIPKETPPGYAQRINRAHDPDSSWSVADVEGFYRRTPFKEFTRVHEATHPPSELRATTDIHAYARASLEKQDRRTRRDVQLLTCALVIAVVIYLLWLAGQ